MKPREAIQVLCNRCACFDMACHRTGCEPTRVLMDRDKEIFAELLVEHRKEEYESELDAVKVGAMISRVADRFVE